MKRLLSVTLLLSFVILLGACKKKGCTDPLALNFDEDAKTNCCCEYPELATLKINFISVLDGVPFNYNMPIDDGTGRMYEYSFNRLYISGIKLTGSAGTYSFDDAYLYIDPETESYDLGTFTPGTYGSIEFAVGVDTQTNNTMLPADFPLDHPLSSQTPAMWWSWNMGYIFLKLEGLVDTSIVPDGSYDRALTFHLGTNPLLRSTSIAYNFSVAKDETATLNIEVDYSKFVDGLDLQSEFTSHTSNDPGLAEKVMDNVPLVFSKQ